MRLTSSSFIVFTYRLPPRTSNMMAGFSFAAASTFVAGIIALGDGAVAPALTQNIRAATAASTPPILPPNPLPVVYTIAGSDSGGGAGIQADLLSIADFGCHGCSAITCLTAQNSVGVTAVHIPPSSFLREQLQTLLADFTPSAIKIGMLANKEVVLTVGAFLQELRSLSSTDATVNGKGKPKVWVVLDPVMISTSGTRLLDEDAQQALIDHVFPFVDVVTPNMFEAEALLGRKILGSTSPSTIEQAARDILQLGCSAVLLKGGHTNEKNAEQSHYACDFVLVAAPPAGSMTSPPRLCDNPAGVWLQTPRIATIHTHGTGCSLSSSLAAALALGEAARQGLNDKTSKSTGAYSAMDLFDACCLSKAYVAAGIAQGRPLGRGPGPVVHTGFPSSYDHYPVVPQQPFTKTLSSVALRHLEVKKGDATETPPIFSRILPIVDSVEWIEQLCRMATGNGDFAIRDIQLRVKGETNKEKICATVQKAQDLCHAAGIRLWINDHWEEAVRAGCFGVHLGQEDLFQCQQAGGLDVLKARNIALGVSTHSFGELAVAIGVQPSYISLGPVFATSSKTVHFDPQGLDMVQKWRQLIAPGIPLVAIGGITTAERAALVQAAGADCVAVIGAITDNGLDPNMIATAVSQFEAVMY